MKNHVNPGHELAFDLSKLRSNIIFPSMPEPLTSSVPDMFFIYSFVYGPLLGV
jgi:hypothetical protein